MSILLVQAVIEPGGYHAPLVWRLSRGGWLVTDNPFAILTGIRRILPLRRPDRLRLQHNEETHGQDEEL